MVVGCCCMHLKFFKKSNSYVIEILNGIFHPRTFKIFYYILNIILKVYKSQLFKNIKTYNIILTFLIYLYEYYLFCCEV